MDLILIRHGKAEDFSGGGDFGRELVEKGRQQARRAGRLLKSAKHLPEIVLSSPLIRARQTADEFCQSAEIPGPVIQSWLASGMSPSLAMSELTAFHDFSRVAIVGHQPDLSQLIEWFIGTIGGAVEMKKGSVACLRVHPPTRGGALLYLVPPKLADDSED